MHARYHVRRVNSLEMIKGYTNLTLFLIMVIKQTRQFVKGIIQNAYKNILNISKLVYVHTLSFPRRQYTIWEEGLYK